MEISANKIHDSILIVHINIESLIKHFDDFKLFLKRLRKTAGVICHVSGYNGYFCNSKTRAGGSAIYVFGKLKIASTCLKIKSDGCEDVWIE